MMTQQKQTSIGRTPPLLQFPPPKQLKWGVALFLVGMGLMGTCRQVSFYKQSLLSSSRGLGSSSVDLLSTISKYTRPKRSNTNYFGMHARQLRKEAKLLQETIWKTIDLSQQPYDKKDGTFPFAFHFFTFGTYQYNETLRRLERQANHSGYFQSVTVHRPWTLPLLDELRDTNEDANLILNHTVGYRNGGGYWLWRFPLLETILASVPIGEYFMLLDAGSSLQPQNPAANAKLIQWLQEIQTDSNSTAGQEIINFNLGEEYPELYWTTHRVFEAFGQHVDYNATMNATDFKDSTANNNNTTWKPALQGQFEGGGLIARNGPQIRELLAKIYTALEPDPWIITNKYNEETKALYPKFQDNRHDQSLLSVACKLTNYCNSKPQSLPLTKDHPVLKTKRRHPPRHVVAELEATELKTIELLALPTAAVEPPLLFGYYKTMFHQFLHNNIKGATQQS